jgi:hypothetical protein
VEEKGIRRPSITQFGFNRRFHPGKVRQFLDSFLLSGHFVVFVKMQPPGRHMQFNGRSSDLSPIFPRRRWSLEKGKVVAGVTRRTELSAPKWAIQREWGENQTHFLGCLDGF